MEGVTSSSTSLGVGVDPRQQPEIITLSSFDDSDDEEFSSAVAAAAPAPAAPTSTTTCIRRQVQKKRKGNHEGATNTNTTTTTRKPKKKPKNQAVKAKANATSSDIAKQPQHDKLDLPTFQKEYEQAKRRILESFPESHKKLFNELGFGRYRNRYLPVMILNPFSAPPGDIRKAWAEKYLKAGLEEDGTSAVGYLVWWIGGNKDVLGEYSVILKNHFLSYERGHEKKLDVVPDAVMNKHRQGKELTPAEEKHQESLAKLHTLKLQPPNERQHPRSLLPQLTEKQFWKINEKGLVDAPFTYPTDFPEEKKKKKVKGYKNGDLRRAVLAGNLDLTRRMLEGYCTTLEQLHDRDDFHGGRTAFQWAAFRGYREKGHAASYEILQEIWERYSELCSTNDDLRAILTETTNDPYKRNVLRHAVESRSREKLDLVFSFYEQVFQDNLAFLRDYFKLDQDYIPAEVKDIVEEKIFKRYKGASPRLRSTKRAASLKNKFRGCPREALKQRAEGANQYTETASYRHPVDNEETLQSIHAETGSPRPLLPGGLGVGCMLHDAPKPLPGNSQSVLSIFPVPQYISGPQDDNIIIHRPVAAPVPETNVRCGDSNSLLAVEMQEKTTEVQDTVYSGNKNLSDALSGGDKNNDNSSSDEMSLSDEGDAYEKPVELKMADCTKDEAQNGPQSEPTVDFTPVTKREIREQIQVASKLLEKSLQMGGGNTDVVANVNAIYNLASIDDRWFSPIPVRNLLKIIEGELPEGPRRESQLQLVATMFAFLDQTTV